MTECKYCSQQPITQGGVINLYGTSMSFSVQHRCKVSPSGIFEKRIKISAESFSGRSYEMGQWMGAAIQEWEDHCRVAYNEWGMSKLASGGVASVSKYEPSPLPKSPTVKDTPTKKKRIIDLYDV